MSFAKRAQDDSDDAEDEITEFSVQIEALVRCEECGTAFDDSGGADDAIEHADKMHDDGEPEALAFGTKEQMREAIRTAVKNAPSECDCP